MIPTFFPTFAKQEEHLFEINKIVFNNKKQLWNVRNNKQRKASITRTRNVRSTKIRIKRTTSKKTTSKNTTTTRNAAEGTTTKIKVYYILILILYFLERGQLV